MLHLGFLTLQDESNVRDHNELPLRFRQIKLLYFDVKYFRTLMIIINVCCLFNCCLVGLLFGDELIVVRAVTFLRQNVIERN